MVELSGLLRTFDFENQHFHCTAHISNFSVQDMFNVLKIGVADNQNKVNL